VTRPDHSLKFPSHDAPAPNPWRERTLMSKNDAAGFVAETKQIFAALGACIQRENTIL
jgi:hypothetical protein